MDQERSAKLLLRCLIGYSAVAVVAFGPATVQSESARAAHVAACDAEHKPGTQERAYCRSGGPSISDGAPKAIFWPFWLSYTIARNL